MSEQFVQSMTTGMHHIVESYNTVGNTFCGLKFIWFKLGVWGGWCPVQKVAEEDICKKCQRIAKSRAAERKNP